MLQDVSKVRPVAPSPVPLQGTRPDRQYTNAIRTGSHTPPPMSFSAWLVLGLLSVFTVCMGLRGDDVVTETEPAPIAATAPATTPCQSTKPAPAKATAAKATAAMPTATVDSGESGRM